MNIFHKVLELWLGQESGTDGQTDVRDRQGYHLMPFRYSSNRRGHKYGNISLETCKSYNKTGAITLVCLLDLQLSPEIFPVL